MENIVLIGMPGAGKSTTGVLLAKAMGLSFTDTDLVLQQLHGRLLQDILVREGHRVFLKWERSMLERLDVRRCVIATGGSAIYSPSSLNKLARDGGKIINLRLNLEEIETRVSNIKTRGIVLRPGQTLAELYDERAPLYEKHCDFSVSCSEKSVEEIVAEIIERLRAGR